jgi:hypothetical protein
MATFTDIYKNELKSSGILSSLGSTVLKRTREKLDVRNMLFGGSGMIAATGQKVFGKGYQAIQKGPAGQPRTLSGQTGFQSVAIDSLLVSSQKQEAQLAIIAKNTMNNNSMARDMNVTRQNIMKLVTMGGGKASRGADMFFKDAAARESLYESQFKKEAPSSATPTPVVEKQKDGGMLGMLSGISTVIGTAITKALSGIPEILKNVFSISNLRAVFGIGETVLSGLMKLLPLMANPAFLGIITAMAGAAWLAKWMTKNNQELNTEEKKDERLAAGAGSPAANVAHRELGVNYLKSLRDMKNVTDEEISLGTSGEYKNKEELSKAISDAEAAGQKSITLKTPRKQLEAQSRQQSRAEQSMEDGSYDAVESKRFAAKAESMSITPTRIGQVIPGIDFEAYANKVGERESRNNYKAENTIGYLGKYQFGAAALEDLGFLKRGASKKGKNKEVLNDPENWNLAGGKQEFLNSPDLQENAFAIYTSKNYGKLIKMKVLNENSTAEEKAGFLMAAHLLGPGGAQKLKQGQVGTDAYGTTSSSYYNLGAQTQASLVASSPTSGTNLSQGSAALTAMNRDLNVAPAPNVIVNAPSTTNVTGGGRPQQVASATNVDAIELFARQSVGP